MTRYREDIVDQAIAWHLHLEEASAEEWHDFTTWLEADAAHADAYDRIVMDDALLTPDILPAIGVRRPPIPANDRAPVVRRRWFAPAAGGAIAAAICAALLLPTGNAGTTAFTIATAPGAHRMVTLEDGTRIELNGGTAITLDHANPRVATLDRGEAVFHVTHDAANPFVLRSGAATVQDLGTVFNVTRAGARLDVGVAEGSVMFEPEHEAVKLKAGMQLRSREDVGNIAIRHVDRNSVGSWRQGRLVFHEEPMTAVAEAIERATAARVKVAPALGSTPFTGVVQLAGGADAVVPRVARLSGASWSHDGNLWSLSSGSHAAP